MSLAEEILFQVEALTDQMVLSLDSADYHDLSEFIYERERLLNDLKLETSAEYEARINRILEQDKLIRAKMITFKDEAQRAIEKFQSADKYKQAYDKEYTADSFFFNQRK